MKIAYITAKTPFGRQETFILTEMLALKKLGVNLIIIPRDKSYELFHKEAETLLKDTLIVPWFNIGIAIIALMFVINNPGLFLKLTNDIVFKARNIKIAIKNLFILPKALYLSKLLKKASISHIHAHWTSTTSTMAYIISKITGIPWSITCHRWDIPENNLLKEKISTSTFTRLIDENGRKEILEIINDDSLSKKVFVIHMGVNIPEYGKSQILKKNIFTIICPANFVLKKGHAYLFKACKLIAKKGVKFKCLIAGDGPLEYELKELVDKLGMQDYINFLGRLPHERLFELYNSNEVDTIVLPSINTNDGEKEGIPVALIEAMSYGIPVISTNTGGIPELIGDGSGIMVREKDSEAIAGAIEKLMVDSIYYNDIAEKGRLKVKTHFNVDTIAKGLINLFSADTKLSHQQEESSSSTV